MQISNGFNRNHSEDVGLEDIDERIEHKQEVIKEVELWYTETEAMKTEE